MAGRADGSHRTHVIVDKLYAVAARTGAAAAGLAERIRSAGVTLAFGAQSISSLGEQAERLMANCGTDILHRSPLPQALLALAGTTAVWEDLHQIGPAGMRIPTGGRRQQTYRIDPDLIRTLPAGQVVLVRNGRWAHVAVALPTALQRQASRSRRRYPQSLQATSNVSVVCVESRHEATHSTRFKRLHGC